MKTLYPAVIAILCNLSAISQLSGIKTIPGDYINLSAAISDLNDIGTGNGGVTFNVLASQTAPSGGYVITATGASSTPVIFQGNGNTISATGGTADTDGIFKLAGSDYITINNFILTGDAAVEWGVALLKKNSVIPYDGCSHNTLINLTITLNKNNTASAGIYAGYHTAASTDILSYSWETGDATSYNNINGNTIFNVYNGILLSSTATGITEGANIIGANQISNYGGASLPAYGIRLENFAQSQVINNLVSLSGGSMADIYGIDVASGMNNVTIRDNTISMSGNIFNHSLTAISCTNTFFDVYIYNNQVTACNVNATTGSFTGIRANNAIALTSTIEGNTISNNTLSGTGNMTLISTGNSWSLTISGNNIYGNTKSGASGSLFCIRTLATLMLNNNLVYSNSISSNSGTDSSKIYGIHAYSGSIINNQVHDLSIAGTATPAISELCGIYASLPDSIADNRIYNLDFNNSSGGSATIKGIASETGSVMRNKISDLNAVAGPGSFVCGIESSAGSVFNNLVGNLHAGAANGANAVAGINITGSAGSTRYIYYNTVVLNDTSTGSGFGTSALSASTTPYLWLKNNILINRSAPGTSGYTVAYRRSSTLLTTYDLSSGYNIYNAGNPGPRNLIFYDGTNADQTLDAFKNRVAPRDSRSVTENTPFQSTDGSSPAFLHVDLVIPTLAESGGGPVSGANTDYDGNLRYGSPRYHGTGTAPDIGADEFEGRTLPLIDVGATLLILYPGTCYGLYDEQIMIMIRNYGLNNIDFAQRPLTITALVTGAVNQTLTATINYSGLAPGASTYFPVGLLNMSTPGIYIFNAYTTLTGDTVGSNNAMPQTTRLVRGFADLPDIIDFTGYDGNNLAALFPGWYEASGPAIPLDSTSLWKSQAGLGNPGNVSARVNLHSSGNKEWIVGPQFWGTSSAELKLDIAVTAKDVISTSAVMGSDDTLSVMISEDCGDSWYSIAHYTAADLLGATLTTKTISLSSYNFRKLIIAIVASDGVIDDPQDYDIHIDNIILNSPIGDVSILSLNSPGSGCYSNAETVSVAIKNNSDMPIFFDPVFMNIEVRVTGPVTTTLTRTLDHMGLMPGEIINVDMLSTVNMSLPGIYRFNASISLPSDSDSTNDRLAEVIRIVKPAVNMPLTVDFASYDGSNLLTVFQGWTEGTGSNTPSGIESAWVSNADLGYAGNISAKVNLSGNTTDAWIISPGLTPNPAIELKLLIALTAHGSNAIGAVMGSDDTVSVMVSPDCGANWTSIKHFTAADALTPALTEFTIRTPGYPMQVLIAIRATDGVVDNLEDYDFHIDDIRLQIAPIVTPVELLSFSGQRLGNANLLKWATASEQNVKGFRVEGSRNGVQYDSIGFVDSKAPGGNSDSRIDYEFADNNPIGERQYYRLKQFDWDGKFWYSNVVLIRNDKPATLVLAGIYPNPAPDKLKVEIQIPYPDVVRMIVVDMWGHEMRERTAVVETGVNTVDLDLRGLVPGVYILKIISKEKGEMVVGRFLKQ